MKKFLFPCFLFLLASSMSASADTIGPSSSCGTCDGVAYTTSYITTTAPPSGQSTPGVYQVQLILNTNSFAFSGTNYLTSVSLKLTSGDATITQLQSPASFLEQSGGISNSGSGCNGNGGGFFCSQYSGPGVGLVVGSGHIYTFYYQVNTNSSSGALLLDGSSHVKARYADSTGKKVGDLTSEDFTLTPGNFLPIGPPLAPPPVPEPSTLVLLGTGILTLAGGIRRRFSAGPR